MNRCRDGTEAEFRTAREEVRSAATGRRSLAVLLGCLAGAAPALAQWSTLPNMPTPRERHVAAGGFDTLGNPRVYVFGGGTSSPTTVVDACDPAGVWDPPGTHAAMPNPRVAPAVATDAAGLIYVIGGFQGGSVTLASIDVYDPGSNSWSIIPSMPTPRGEAGATFGPDGRLYVVGGSDASGAVIHDALEIYDPGLGAWVVGDDLPVAHGNIGAAPGCDGRIWAVGGRAASDTCPSGFSQTYAYDIALDQWTTETPMPACLGGRGVVLGPDDRIYAVNDGDYFTLDNQVYALDTSVPGGAWSAAPFTAVGFTDLGVAALGDSIYAVGGIWKFIHAANHVRTERLVTGVTSVCAPPPPCVDLLATFTPDRFSQLPPDRMQVVAMYDGDGTPTLDIHLSHPLTGACCVLSIPGLNNTTITTLEFDMHGYEPTGRVDVGGVVPNGAIDGVAFGLYMREALVLGADRWLLRSAAPNLAAGTPNFVGGWPVAWSESTWDSKLTALAGASVDAGVARRQAQMTLSGAQMLPNGTWGIPTGRIAGDVNGDGCTDINDLLIMLGAFGVGCCP